MGKPIRERGIKWVETYGEKSAYLKKEMEEQVGPGSYFRWEGHDTTTGTDYYVVVSPGYSKKKGYHFFAGLRKMPADHGASGKKFPTQRLALGYAMDTWRVPPPEIKPGKPYVAQDITGKPIVTEGVHADTQAASKGGITIIAPSNAKNAEEHVGMALHSSSKYSDTHRIYTEGNTDSSLEWIATAGLAMGYGAAAASIVELVNTDAMNYDATTLGDNEITGKQGVKLVPTMMMATCDQPDQKTFDQNLSAGHKQYNKLFEPKKRKNGKAIIISPPAFREPQGQGYSHVTFNDIKEVSGEAVVGATSNAKFQQAMTELAGKKSSIPGSAGVTFVVSKSPAPGERNEYVYKISTPIDLFKDIKEASKKYATLKLPNFTANNALMLYEAAQRGMCYTTDQDGNETPVTPEDLLTKPIPVFENFHRKGNALVHYDTAGMPLGVAVGRSSSIGLEEDSDKDVAKTMPAAPGEEGAPAAPAEEQKAQKAKYSFTTEAKARMLAQAGGDVNRLREMVDSGAIKLTHDMFVEDTTCGPLMRPVYQRVPLVEKNFRPLGGGDSMKYGVRPVTPDMLGMAAQVKWGDELVHVVRVMRNGKEVLTRLPEGVEPIQQGSGARTMREAYMWQRNEAGEWHQIKAGEWAMVDDKSKGKFIPGATNKIMFRPLYRSPKNTDRSRIHQKGERRDGYFLGTVDMWAQENYIQGPPPKNDPTVPPENIVKDAKGRAIGYYVVKDRQHPNKPFTVASPTEGKPLKVTMYERQDGFVVPVRNPDGTPKQMNIDVSQAEKNSDGNGLVFKDSAIGAHYLKNVLALSDEDMGDFVGIKTIDTSIIDDLVISANRKIEQVEAGTLPPDALSEQERIYYEAIFKKDRTSLFRKLNQIETDPDAYKPRVGNIFSIKYAGTSDWATSEVFPVQEIAQDFMQKMLEDNPEQKLEVAIFAENAPLVFSKHGTSDPMGDLRVMRPPSAQEPEVPQEEPQQSEEQPQEAAPEQPLAEMPPQEAIPEQQPQVAEPEVPVQPQAPVAQEPVVQQQPPPPAVPPQRSKPKVPGQQEELAMAGKTMARLIALADKLDKQGRHKEADAVDKVIRLATKRASEKA